MDFLSLEIITPESKLFEGLCSQVDAPGSEGRVGILARHVNFVTSLKAGLIEITQTDLTKLRIVVNGGLLEMSDNKCSILVEKGMDIDHTNLDTIGARLAKINEEIVNLTGIERQMMEKEIAYLNEVISHFTLTK